MFLKQITSVGNLKIAIVVFSMLFLANCASLGSAQKQETSVPLAKSQFDGKTIAILPVSETQIQSASATESIRNMRMATNQAIDEKVAKLIPKAKIITFKTSAMMLSNADKLKSLDELIKLYDATGSFDKNTVESICSCLNADYIVVSRLSAAKMDASIFGKGINSRLEVGIVSNTSKELVWGGIGSYKKAGTLGFGGVEDKEAANELVDLAFSKYE